MVCVFRSLFLSPAKCKTLETSQWFWIEWRNNEKKHQPIVWNKNKRWIHSRSRVLLCKIDAVWVCSSGSSSSKKKNAFWKRWLFGTAVGWLASININVHWYILHTKSNQMEKKVNIKSQNQHQKWFHEIGKRNQSMPSPRSHLIYESINRISSQWNWIKHNFNERRSMTTWKWWNSETANQP